MITTYLHTYTYVRMQANLYVQTHVCSYTHITYKLNITNCKLLVERKLHAQPIFCSPTAHNQFWLSTFCMVSNCLFIKAKTPEHMYMLLHKCVLIYIPIKTKLFYSCAQMYYILYMCMCYWASWQVQDFIRLCVNYVCQHSFEHNR